MTRSSLLAAVSGLDHGFLANHTHEGRVAHDQTSPNISTVNQVHGDQLLWSDSPERRERNADAIATEKPRHGVGVYSADCAPILVVALSKENKPMAVMAVHGGWRGTANLIAEKSLTAFAEKLGSKAHHYLAAIGPCIGFESFEVGEEVVKAFPRSEERGLARFFRQEGAQRKFLFDLSGENERQLRETAAAIGIQCTIEVIPHCTFTLREIYPSFRREGKNAGRILSYLSFEG